MKEKFKIIVPKNQVLRYLGYRNQQISTEMNCMIDEIRKECKSLINPKIVYSRYRNHIENDHVCIDSTNLILKGKDIRSHLSYSNEVFILAATIGNLIEKRIKLYETVNLTKAVILDACATTAIEEFLDCLQENLKSMLCSENLSLTFRYSPGYGDLSLDIQQNIINILGADKFIGLHVTEHSLLIPRKSVTAIIGIIPKDREQIQQGCEKCKNYGDCVFRREGINCEY